MNKRGQSVLEYVIILTVVITAIITFSKLLGPKVGKILDDSATRMETTGNLINK